MRWQDWLILGLLVGAYVIYFKIKKRRPKTRRRRRPGNELTRREQGAWRKLQAQGYRLEEIHPSLPVVLDVDERTSSFTYNGNFIVSKGGKTYLVKVKRGDAALSSVGMRHELLLDYISFQTNGFFLYDSDKERLQQLNFSFGGGKDGGDSGERLLWQMGLFMLIVIAIVFLYRLVF